MRAIVIIAEPASASGRRTRTRSVSAIAEVDEFGYPLAAEILWLKAWAGESDFNMLLAAMKHKLIAHHYSADVDTLTISCAQGVRSFGQVPGVLEIEFDGDRIVRLTLRQSA